MLVDDRNANDGDDNRYNRIGRRQADDDATVDNADRGTVCLNLRAFYFSECKNFLESISSVEGATPASSAMIGGNNRRRGNGPNRRRGGGWRGGRGSANIHSRDSQVLSIYFANFLTNQIDRHFLSKEIDGESGDGAAALVSKPPRQTNSEHQMPSTVMNGGDS